MIKFKTFSKYYTYCSIYIAREAYTTLLDLYVDYSTVVTYRPFSYWSATKTVNNAQDSGHSAISRYIILSARMTTFSSNCKEMELSWSGG